MLPIWLGMLGAAIFKAEYRGAMSGIEGVVVVASILAVVGGIIGLVGLRRSMRLLLNPDAPAAVSARTRLYVFVGIATPILLAIVSFWRDLRLLFFLSVLPTGRSFPHRNVGWRTTRGVEHLEFHSQHRAPDTTASRRARRYFNTDQSSGLDIRCWPRYLVRGHGSQLPAHGCIGLFGWPNEWVAA